MKIAKERYLVIVHFTKARVIETTAHACPADAEEHAEEMRARSDVHSVEESLAPLFQGRRVTRVWL